MAEIHSPDIYGIILLDTDAGIGGQVLTSQGPTLPPLWLTPELVTIGIYFIESSSATTHVITHLLDNEWPVITVWDDVSKEVITPDSIVSDDPDTLTITFLTAHSIHGTVVG